MRGVGVLVGRGVLLDLGVMVEVFVERLVVVGWGVAVLLRPVALVALADHIVGVGQFKGDSLRGGGVAVGATVLRRSCGVGVLEGRSVLRGSGVGVFRGRGVIVKGTVVGTGVAMTTRTAVGVT